MLGFCSFGKQSAAAADIKFKSQQRLGVNNVLRCVRGVSKMSFILLFVTFGHVYMQIVEASGQHPAALWTAGGPHQEEHSVPLVKEIVNKLKVRLPAGNLHPFDSSARRSWLHQMWSVTNESSPDPCRSDEDLRPFLFLWMLKTNCQRRRKSPIKEDQRLLWFIKS